MNKTVSKIGLCAAFLILLAGHPAQADDAQTMPAAETTKIKGVFPARLKLKAVISADDEFPELPDSLEPGNPFDADKVYSLLSPENHWYEIPKWFAGEFSYGDTQTYYQKDFATGEVSDPHQFSPGQSTGRTRGAVVDKKGNIWHLSQRAEILFPSHADKKDDFRYEDEILGFMLSPNEYTESSEGIEFFTDEGKIKDVLRYQRVRNFQLQPDGKVAADVSEMKFDLQGKPLYQVKAKSHMTKQKDFVAIGPKSEIEGGTYAALIGLLRQHMERVNKLSDAPDPI